MRFLPMTVSYRNMYFSYNHDFVLSAGPALGTAAQL